MNLTLNDDSHKRTRSDELKLLDFLTDDFVNRRRFILAAQQMIRLLRSEDVWHDTEMQAKVSQSTRLVSIPVISSVFPFPDKLKVLIPFLHSR